MPWYFISFADKDPWPSATGEVSFRSAASEVSFRSQYVMDAVSKGYESGNLPKDQFFIFRREAPNHAGEYLIPPAIGTFAESLLSEYRHKELEGEPDLTGWAKVEL